MFIDSPFTFLTYIEYYHQNYHPNIENPHRFIEYTHVSQN
jgi:hypothetical protein